MSLIEKIFKYLMAIPHLALLLDLRKYQRFTPLEGLDIKIEINNMHIYSVLIDISLGGMTIFSTDSRIMDTKKVSLSVDNFFLELPFEKIRQIHCHYGIKFGSVDNKYGPKLKYFIEHYTQPLHCPGQTELMR